MQLFQRPELEFPVVRTKVPKSLSAETPQSTLGPGQNGQSAVPLGPKRRLQAPPPETKEETETIKGAPLLLTAAADFLTALGPGGPRAALRQQQLREGILQNRIRQGQQRSLIRSQIAQQQFDDLIEADKRRLAQSKEERAEALDVMQIARLQQLIAAGNTKAIFDSFQIDVDNKTGEITVIDKAALLSGGKDAVRTIRQGRETNVVIENLLPPNASKDDQRRVQNALGISAEEGIKEANRVIKDIQTRVERSIADATEAGKEARKIRRERFNAESKLRADYLDDPAVKESLSALSSFRRIIAIRQNPTPASDIAMIFTFMRALEPGVASVVREGEQLMARQAGGVPERIRLMYNQAVAFAKGESIPGLSPSQREFFFREVLKFAKVGRRKLLEANGRFHRNAEEFSLNPNNILSAGFPDIVIDPATGEQIDLRE